MPVDIQLPTPRVAPAASSERCRVGERRAGGGADRCESTETGREGDPTPRSDGLIVGVESGPPASAIEGFGVTESVPPPPPPPAGPIRLHSGMKAPVKMADAAPVYPAIARSAHIQGVVILEAVLDAQGRVESVRVLRSIPLLDQAAVDAVQQWRSRRRSSMVSRCRSS